MPGGITGSGREKPGIGGIGLAKVLFRACVALACYWLACAICACKSSYSIVRYRKPYGFYVASFSVNTSA